MAAEGPFVGLLVDLGAADLAAAADDVDRGFLAALELRQDFVDEAVFNKGFNPLGGFHAVRVRSWVSRC
jgi:hypothetical protein